MAPFMDVLALVALLCVVGLAAWAAGFQAGRGGRS